MADVSNYKVYGQLPTIGAEQVQKLIEQSEGDTLPEVTAADNGKVLTVVEGEWDKANAGGGGVLIVNATENESQQLVCDKTAGEMSSAFRGNGIIIKTTENDVDSYCQVNGYYASDSGYGFFFFDGTTFLAATESDYPETRGSD